MTLDSGFCEGSPLLTISLEDSQSERAVERKCEECCVHFCPLKFWRRVLALLAYLRVGLQRE